MTKSWSAKDKTNDKVFVKESFKILNGIAAFKDDSVDEVENVEVYSKVNVDPWVEELQAEIERLKGELEMEHDDCSNAKKCEVEYHKAYEKELNENVTLRKENAKLKCLALHLMWYCMRWFKGELYVHRDGCIGTNAFKRKQLDNLIIKYRETYRKAKQELMEGK